MIVSFVVAAKTLAAAGAGTGAGAGARAGAGAATPQQQIECNFIKSEC